MPNTQADRLKFAAAVTEYKHAHGVTLREAVIATLPDWLEWDGTGYSGGSRGSSHGGGMAPECAGFDTFELDREHSPDWAVKVFESRTEEEQEEIITLAEQAEIERMQP